MIKTLIFDNGGVIVDDAWLKFEIELNQKYGKKSGNIASKINEYGKEAACGRLTHSQLMAKVRKMTKNSQEQEALFQPTEPKKDVLSYIEELSHIYELALLTNELANFEHDNRIWHLEKYFGERIYCSSKIGYAKPEPEAYEFVLSSLERQPEEAILIDDKETNLEGARQVGLNVIQFSSLDQLKTDLPKVIKEVNANK